MLKEMEKSKWSAFLELNEGNGKSTPPSSPAASLNDAPPPLSPPPLPAPSLPPTATQHDTPPPLAQPRLPSTVMPTPRKPEDLPLSPSILSPGPFTPKNRRDLKALLLDKQSEQKKRKHEEKKAKCEQKEMKKKEKEEKKRETLANKRKREEGKEPKNNAPASQSEKASQQQQKARLKGRGRGKGLARLRRLALLLKKLGKLGVLKEWKQDQQPVPAVRPKTTALRYSRAYGCPRCRHSPNGCRDCNPEWTQYKFKSA